MARADDDVDDRDGDEEEVAKKPKKSNDGKLTDDEKMWAMFAHLGNLVAWIIAPLIIWQVKKDESEFVTLNAKASLNFAITWLIISMLTCGLAGIVAMILVIVGGLAANRGEVYKYPMTITFVS